MKRSQDTTEIRPVMHASLIVLALTLLLAVPQQIMAQSRVGTSAAVFLTLGNGARASALGHAYTATSRGADALFWNPSGSAIRQDNLAGGQVFLSHFQWFAGININSGAAVVPVGKNTFGISIYNVDYGREEITRVGQENGTGISYDASDLSVGITYARPLTESFFFGATAKYVQQQIWDSNARTIAIDAGFTLLTDFWNGIRIAGSINNFGGKMQMEGVNLREFIDIADDISESNEQIPANIDTDAWNLPIQVRAGLAAPVFVAKNFQLEAMVDAQQTNDNLINADFGGEFRYFTKSTEFNLRAGYRDFGLDNSTSHLSYGVGVNINLIQYVIGFDFAITEFEQLGYVQMIDFRFSF